MKSIDLTTPESALDYLASLPCDKAISLPGVGESSTEGDAVVAITGCASANEWARSHRRWDWTANELVEALCAETQSEDAAD